MKLIDEKEWECIAEYEIPCSTATLNYPKQTFTIDLCFINKKTDQHINVLLKALEKGINKNRQNAGNTTSGECDRIYSHSEYHGDKLTKERKDWLTIFITLVPSIELDTGRPCKDTGPSLKTLRERNPNIFKLDVLFNVDKTKETQEERINSLGFIDNEEDVVEVLTNIKEAIHGSKKSI